MGLRHFVASATRTTQLDRLCGELGWPIDFRNGNVIGLYFKGDRVTERRTVAVAHEDGDRIMIFSCQSRAVFSERSLPDSLPIAMLVRNDGLTFGAWAACIEGDELTLSLRYVALAASMDAAHFKLICTLMVKEVAEIEAKLHGNGLL